jgi:hypothetical protein
VKREAEVKRERENQGGAQSRKVGRAAGKHRAGRGKQKAVHVRAGETEGCTDFGKSASGRCLPIIFYARHSLSVLGVRLSRRVALQVVNIYACRSAFFLGHAFIRWRSQSRGAVVCQQYLPCRSAFFPGCASLVGQFAVVRAGSGSVLCECNV